MRYPAWVESCYTNRGYSRLKTKRCGTICCGFPFSRRHFSMIFQYLIKIAIRRVRVALVNSPGKSNHCE